MTGDGVPEGELVGVVALPVRELVLPALEEIWVDAHQHGVHRVVYRVDDHLDRRLALSNLGDAPHAAVEQRPRVIVAQADQLVSARHLCGQAPEPADPLVQVVPSAVQAAQHLACVEHAAPVERVVTHYPAARVGGVRERVPLPDAHGEAHDRTLGCLPVDLVEHEVGSAGSEESRTVYGWQLSGVAEHQHLPSERQKVAAEVRPDHRALVEYD